MYLRSYLHTFGEENILVEQSRISRFDHDNVLLSLKIVAAVCADLRGAPDEVSVAELLAIRRRVRQHDRDPHLFPSSGLLVLASLSPAEPAPAIRDSTRVPRRQLRVAL